MSKYLETALSIYVTMKVVEWSCDLVSGVIKEWPMIKRKIDRTVDKAEPRQPIGFAVTKIES